MDLKKMDRIAYFCGVAGTLVSAFCWGFVFDNFIKKNEEL